MTQKQIELTTMQKLNKVLMDFDEETRELLNVPRTTLIYSDFNPNTLHKRFCTAVGANEMLDFQFRDMEELVKVWETYLLLKTGERVLFMEAPFDNAVGWGFNAGNVLEYDAKPIRQTVKYSGRDENGLIF